MHSHFLLHLYVLCSQSHACIHRTRDTSAVLVLPTTPALGDFSGGVCHTVIFAAPVRTVLSVSCVYTQNS